MQTDPKLYIPHRGQMCLLDEVSKVDAEMSECTVSITEKSTFYDEMVESIPNWVGVEYMAQAVAAYAGFHSQAVKIGLLLSVRKYQSQWKVFPLGSRLKIYAHKVYLEEEMGVFNCEIWADGQRIASGKLNTIQPGEETVKEILSSN